MSPPSSLAMLLLGFTIWVVGAAFGSLPGDAIPASAALGQVTLYGVMMLSVGGVAFATAPWLGRTRAMAFGLIVLFASYLIYSYASLSPVIDALKPLSFFRWTEGHRPMAGVSDWPSVAALAVITVVLFAIGVVGFVRRDLGGVANVGWLRLPSLPAGIAGPFSRQLADRTGIALAWGLGIGLYGILIVASADAFSDMITNLPQIAALIETIYPGLDLTQPSAVLQLTFFGFGSFIIGLSGATFLAGWASDEGRRRLEVVLSTPRSRASWAMRSGLGVMGAIGVVTLVIALLIGIAVVDPGRRRRRPGRGRRHPGPHRRGFRWRRACGRGTRAVVAGGRGDRRADHRDTAHRYPRRGAQAAPVGARPVDLQAPRPADGGHLRSGRARSPRRSWSSAAWRSAPGA